MSSYNRSITLSQGIALYVAAILGSGILFLSASTATVAGPASILAWLIMILFSFPLAYTFAVLSRSYPDAGGAATFVRLAFGQHLGNLVGWFYFLTAAVGQMIVALTGANYIGVAFQLSAAEVAMIACGILVSAGVSNHFGLQVSGRVSLVLSTILLTMLCAAVVVTFPYMNWDQFQPLAPHGWLPVGTAIVMIFWSFFGWEAISNLAERFKHPQKDLIRSALLSATIIGIVFLLLSIVTVGSGTYGSIQTNTSPIGVMIHRGLGFQAQVITAILALIICMGTTNAFVASLAQLGYALSRDGAFPAWLFYLNARTQTPTRVVWLVILFAGLGVILTTMMHVHFTQLLFIPNSLGMMVYILSMAAALKLCEKYSKPWLSGLFCLLMLVLFMPFLSWHILVPLLVTGMYWLYQKGLGKVSVKDRKQMLGRWKV
ncbi:amino acid efflux transporter [Caldalkalibacillus uzonensis]|uniref:Amino acid efflux transporter n=1 Tax=Caldalkalibacillus uzonensis TaxID=353224 RepID=A0ABU0CXN3_9BACI|nr:amino acid permease [Caldalkalibacillus uzonensis]MDQ0340472.1 amino acid efflux transporter [Caldalkalibacillus uzonensis]